MIIHHSAIRMFLYAVTIMFLIMNCYAGQRVRFRYADSVPEFAFSRLLWLNFKNRTKNNILSPLSIYVSHTCLMTGAEDETWYALARELYLPSEFCEEVTEEFAAVAMISRLFLNHTNVSLLMISYRPIIQEIRV